MINPFERFYDTEIEVYEVGENTYEKKGEKTLLGSVVCDIQPYEKYKVFCDKTDLIKIGRYAKFGDEFFEIIKAECWNFGMTAMMRSEKNAD